MTCAECHEGVEALLDIHRMTLSTPSQAWGQAKCLWPRQVLLQLMPLARLLPAPYNRPSLYKLLMRMTLNFGIFIGGELQSCRVSTIRGAAFCWTPSEHCRELRFITFVASTEKGMLSHTHLHLFFHTHHIIIDPCSKVAKLQMLDSNHLSTIEPTSSSIVI